MPYIRDREYKHHEQYFVDLSDRPEKLKRALGTIVCTDDRGMKGVEFARQLAGGAHGMRTDIETALRLAKRRTQSMRGGLASEVRMIAQVTGATTHEECAAENLAAPIDRFMANPDNADYLFEAGNKLAPGLIEERDIDIVQSAATYRTDIDYFAGDNGYYPDVPRLALGRAAVHEGPVMIASDIPNSFHKTVEAYDDGNASYGLSLSLGTTDALKKAMVLRSAAVAAHLPNPAKGPGGKGVDLTYLGRGLARAV